MNRLPMTWAVSKRAWAGVLVGGVLAAANPVGGVSAAAASVPDKTATEAAETRAGIEVSSQPRAQSPRVPVQRNGTLSRL